MLKLKVSDNVTRPDLSYSLPLFEFLDLLYEHHKATYDQLSDAWRSPLWDFCRPAKGHPELRQLFGQEALAKVEGWMRSRRMRWTDSFAVSSAEDARVEFLHVWDVIHSVPGYTPLEAALDKAKESPLPALNTKYQTEGYAQFLSVACWLHKIMRKQPIFLPCHKLAKLLGCEHTTVARYRKFAIADGLLGVTKDHTYRSNGRGEATE